MNKIFNFACIALSSLIISACAHINGAAKPPASAMPDYTQDVIAIQQLLARYAFALDGRNGEAWAATFVENGTFETIGRPKLVGRRQIADTINNSKTKPFAARHMVQNPVIKIDGDDATMQAYLLVTGEGGKILVTGNYEDKLRRVNGQWLFVERRFSLDPTPAP